MGLAFYLAFLFLFSSEAVVSAGTYSGGTGEPNNPYRIATPNDLNDIANHPEDYNDCFILVNDINMAGYDYTTAVIAPDIDNSTWEFDGIAFTGVFDGNDHTISSLVIDDNDVGNDYLGLFGMLGEGSVVKNLKIKDVNIIGGDESYRLGGLCGKNGEWDNPGGSVSNCYATGSVSGGVDSECLGSLCGLNFGTISNCYATGPVNGRYTLGGLCGGNSGTISNCYATGSVGGEDYLGGLCGKNNTTISNCYFLDIAGPNNGYGTPLTDSQMKQQASFVGWDFVSESINGTEDIWRMCVDGVEYPKLSWEFSLGDIVCPDGVNFVDYSVLIGQWLQAPSWPDADIAPPGGDGIVDWLDLKVLCDNWLLGTE